MRFQSRHVVADTGPGVCHECMHGRNHFAGPRVVEYDRDGLSQV